jgi:hypothetical protein
VQRVPPDGLTVLFDRPTMDGVMAGTVTLAFRRWRRPTVRSGGALTTAMGVLAIDDVRVIAPEDITDADVERTGATSREALLAGLAARDGDLYRIELHLAGPDPRVALRQRDELTPDDVDELGRRLARLDAASSHGPWTAAVLELIAARPAVRAGDLADELGRERLPFKADVRKLKALGLTESLEVGYRISRRGQAWLRRP